MVDFIRCNQDVVHGVHKSCKLDIFNKATKVAKLSVASDKHTAGRKRTRTATVSFDFKELCFYCSKPTSECKRDEWHCVETLEMRETIMQAALSRPNDPWSLEIKGRLEYATDLIALEARYHFECHRNFTAGRQHTPHKVRRGRPVTEVAQNAFDDLCDELLANGENEFFTLPELHNKMIELARDRYGADDRDVYGISHLRNKLKERFKDTIYFASRSGRSDVIGFRGLCDLILTDKYFLSKNVAGVSEAEHVVMKAAALILADIRETEFDRAFYPTTDDIDTSGGGLRFVPPLLQLLLQRLIVNPLKQVSFGQGIVQATKPNACIMPIMFGLGVQIDRLGHRNLHDELARLGFCMSNAEVRRCKFSLMSNADMETESSSDSKQSVPFTQFVADNFDHNVRTLDGLGTFHGMGIIAATVGCGSFGSVDCRVRRCTEMPVSAAIKDKCVSLLPFKRSSNMQLQDLSLCPFAELRTPAMMPNITNLINIWHIGLFTGATKARPNWLGFMQSVCGGSHPGACHIKFLSLVDRNPADYDCIYSTLLYVSDQARTLGLPTVCITFDQPLYIKALDVTLKAELDVVVRLGGFHTLMSFMGSLGHIMRGSGIEEALLLLYGENTIEHVLSGKAYAKAVRAHFLIQSALVQLLIHYLATPAEGSTLQNVVIDSVTEQSLASSVPGMCIHDIETLYEHILIEGFDQSTECDSLVVLSQLLERVKCVLREQCRTAHLWITYIEYVDVLRKFLIAERTGDWLLHLDAVQCMLPLFSVTGHMNYARSARIYLQQMRNLPQTHTRLFEQFMQGNHVIRRSNQFWAGLSPDLCIEQTLMQSGKSHDGLTHGYGKPWHDGECPYYVAQHSDTLFHCSRGHAEAH